MKYDMSKILEKLKKLKKLMDLKEFMELKTIVLLSAVLLAASCSKDDDNVSSVDPAESREAPVQVMMVFAPGQLGDKGYADAMLHQLELFNQESNNTGSSVDVHFISSNYYDFTKSAIRTWIQTSSEVERRLIVLTEFYMAEWLEDVKSDLRPTDELLLMKANEDDVKSAAASLALNNRVHGLNISAAYSVRRFCTYMDNTIPVAEAEGVNLKRDTIAQCRMYSNKLLNYRDSVTETMHEVLGETSELVNIPIVADEGYKIEAIDGQALVNQEAYKVATYWQDTYQKRGFGFVIVDLGAGNSGWDIWLLGHWSEDYFAHIKTLMIDTNYSDVIQRYSVIRAWDKAFMEWATDWTKQPVGAMPASVTRYGKDYCKDNLPVED